MAASVGVRRSVGSPRQWPTRAGAGHFKGLGEMMPKVVWETTLNPRTRRLLRVEVTDQIVTDRIMNELMGKDASARFRFIMERADEAEELDV
jgi:DNA gyrase subunit B